MATKKKVVKKKVATKAPAKGRKADVFAQGKRSLANRLKTRRQRLENL